MSYTVAQNTFFMTAASVLQKVVSFGYFTIIARLIGVNNTGQYFFAIAFTTIFTVIADFGLGPVLTREAAKFPEQSQKYLVTLFWTKIFFGLMAYGLIVLSVWLLGYSTNLRHLIYLSGVTMFFDNMQSVFYSLFRARRNLRYESFAMVASQVCTLIIGTVALWQHASMVWLIAAYTIPSSLNAIFAGISAKRVYGIRIFSVWDKQLCWNFCKLAFPFALAGFIGRLYSYSDSILMSKFLSQEHLGWWSVPYKITFAFQFIPAALSASIYPAMSALALTNKAKIDDLFNQSWRYLFMIVLPLALGLIAIARPVILKLYGAQFLPSVFVLRILLISLIFTFLSFVNAALLNALNHQKIQTGLMTIAWICNVGLNLYLLRFNGVAGAAIAALISSFILWLGGYIAASRTAELHHSIIARNFWRTFWPAAIMAWLIYHALTYIHFIFLIPLGAMLYFGLLFVSGALNKEILTIYYQKIFQRHSV